MKHRPILCIYQDGDSLFFAFPDFVNLQESPVVWMDEAACLHELDVVSTLRAKRKYKTRYLSNEEKDAVFERAHMNRVTINPWAYRGG